MAPFGDRKDADVLNAAWDKIIGPGDPNAPATPSTNPYDAQIESEEVAPANDDQNLFTAYALLSTWGFEHPLGQMMASYAERKTPYTAHQLFIALDKTRESNKREVQQLKEQIRGMTAMLYAWSYVYARTKMLAVRDRDIYPAIAEISSSDPNSDDRSRLTASAENKLEHTLGVILQALNETSKLGKENLCLFYQGSLQMLYALSNVHYGKGAVYDPA
jgi:hypothetical protein